MKVLAIIMAVIMGAAVIAYDIDKSNDLLYNNPGHKCGGSWVQSQRSSHWQYCSKCGEWREK